MQGASSRSPVAVALFTTLFLFSGAAFLYLFSDYVTDFLLGFMFTGFLSPLYTRLRMRFPERRPWIASTACCTLLVLLVALPLSFLVTSISQEAANAYSFTVNTLTMEKIEGFLFGEGFLASNAKRLAQALNFDYTPESVKLALTRMIASVAQFLSSQVNVLLQNIFSVIYHFVIMVLIVFYMLIDGDRLKRFIFRLSPLPDDEEELLAAKFKDVGRATLFGNGVGSAIQGFLGAISMVVVGIPSPILWGTVMTIFAFLPLVGISIVTIPATLYLLVSERYLAALLFFGFNTAQALVVENVVKTKLIGDHMQMHNLLIFLSILGGIGMFGILGIFYGPLVVTLFLTLLELYEAHYMKRILGGEGTPPTAG